ncbi:MAG: polysaccharide pyruvyl transferase family protein [Verrucomicrobiota bacterium]
MKILIGGVPFGRDNVGDEAILETVVNVVRECSPDAELTVSTDDREATEKKLSVNTVPLFGFAPPYSKDEMRQSLESHDVFIWAGATGLSDYPEIPANMLRIAQEARNRTVVWNVGMNDELNPAKYKLTSGKKKRLLDLVTAVTFGLVNGVDVWERGAINRAKTAIRTALDRADLVVVRDPESREVVLDCGVSCEVVVGADTALLLKPSESLKLEPDLDALVKSGKPLFGLCVSAQRKIQNVDKLVNLLNRIVSDLSANIVFIPMNPVTDSDLMKDLHERMEPELQKSAVLFSGRREPDEVLALSQHLDVVASSRLHLLILSSIFHIPLIGISRGSKVDNFLNPYGLKAVGTVEACDFDAFFNEVKRLIQEKDSFSQASKGVFQELKGRLDGAVGKLRKALA